MSVVQVQFSSADVEETAELPQLHLVELWTGCCMPVVCNDKCGWSMTWRSSSTAMDVSVIMQRRLRQWKCPIFSSSPGAGGHFQFATEGRHGGGVEV